MKHTPVWAFAVAILVWTRQADASAFQYNGDLTCSEGVQPEVYSVTCNGSETCYLGDEVDIYGKLTLVDELASYKMCVATDLCFMGIGFLCKSYKRRNVNICNTLGVSSADDGTACPAAGWHVKVNMEFNDCNKYSNNVIKCQATFVAVSPMDYYEEGYAAAGVLAVVALLYIRKRRQLQVVPPEGGDANNFEMMKDTGVRV